MSSFYKLTKNPRTGKFEEAAWLDNHFGGHRYGVKFPDGTIYNPDYQDLPTKEYPRKMMIDSREAHRKKV